MEEEGAVTSCGPAARAPAGIRICTAARVVADRRLKRLYNNRPTKRPVPDKVNDTHPGPIIGAGHLQDRVLAPNTVIGFVLLHQVVLFRSALILEKYLARYVFKVAISESRIQSVDDTHVCFTYRKVHSNRVRTMRLPILAFLHRFLQHVLPTGFMKLRYFGFLSPSFKMPFEQIKARIELAQGFNVKPPPSVEVQRRERLRCPRCGATLTYRRTILPREQLRQRIAQCFAPAPAMIQALNAGP
ncbi:MAG: transposase [Burkholderiales bacterium]